MLDYRGALVDAYTVARDYCTEVSQTAAVIYDEHDQVLCDGWTCFPHGISEANHPGSFAHSIYCECAEEAAILCAARMGLCTKNATMVCPTGTCFRCAKTIISAGITALVVHEPAMKPTTAGLKLLGEANVTVRMYDGVLNVPGLEIMRAGVRWMP